MRRGICRGLGIVLHGAIIDQKGGLAGFIGAIAAALGVGKTRLEAMRIGFGQCQIGWLGSGGIERCRGLPHKGIITGQRDGKALPVARGMAQLAVCVGECLARRGKAALGQC